MALRQDRIEEIPVLLITHVFLFGGDRDAFYIHHLINFGKSQSFFTGDDDHADLKTTQEYYLSVQDDDLKAARRATQKIVGGLTNVSTTDHKLTNPTPKRSFPKRKVFDDGTQLPSAREVA